MGGKYLITEAAILPENPVHEMDNAVKVKKSTTAC